MKTTITTLIITLIYMFQSSAMDLDGLKVSYETNPGTNTVTYTALTPETGTFELTLQATEPFGGGTQKSKGQYAIKKDGEWTYIVHQTEKNIIFILRVKPTDGGGYSISTRGNIFDKNGNPASQEDRVFEFKPQE